MLNVSPDSWVMVPWYAPYTCHDVGDPPAYVTLNADTTLLPNGPSPAGSAMLLAERTADTLQAPAAGIANTKLAAAGTVDAELTRTAPMPMQAAGRTNGKRFANAGAYCAHPSVFLVGQSAPPHITDTEGENLPAPLSTEAR